jgi:type 1 glutamine amidotransferase
MGRVVRLAFRPLMKSLLRTFIVAAGLAAALVPLTRAADTASAPRKKILFFTKSSGFQHDAVKLVWKDGKPGYAFPVIEEIGKQNNIEFVHSKDGSLFTAAYLAQFDGFLFYTSGGLNLPKSDPRGDGLPPISAEGKAALLAAIRGGKGFVGVHSASDTYHSMGRNDHVPERFNNDGDQADDYIKMLGGEFIRHGAQQTSHLIVADAKFPGVAAVPATYAMHEEWYSLKNFAADLHVLLVQDTKGMNGAEYERAPYPSTWVHPYGKGRVFYTNMGHRDDVWSNPVFQSVLVGGINWSLGRVDADITPNLKQVAPEANVLPKFEAPPAGQPKKDAKKSTDKAKQ